MSGDVKGQNRCFWHIPWHLYLFIIWC